MSPEFVIVCVVAIMFFASLVRSTFGFADALIAMPLLDFVVDLDVARPLVAMFSVIIAVVVIARDFKSIKIASVWRLIVAAVFWNTFRLLCIDKCTRNLGQGIVGTAGDRLCRLQLVQTAVVQSCQRTLSLVFWICRRCNRYCL